MIDIVMSVTCTFSNLFNEPELTIDLLKVIDAQQRDLFSQ